MVKNNILDAELSENLKNIKKELEKLKEEKISSEEKQQENISQNEKPEKFFKKKKDVIEIEISEQTVDSDEKRIPKKKRQPARKKPKVLESPIENEKSEISEISEEITPTKLKADTKEEKMYVIPLGGTDEVGKNMTVVQYRDEIIIMDCGVIFPDENLPGIDLVIPDFTYLENNKNKIKGLFITHGHEDHIGAIPYLYQKIDKSVPMYGGKLTLALVKSKFEGNNLTRHMPKGKEVRARQKIKIGKYFTIEFVKVTHSIADSYAIAVTTPAGTILNTGDFKIDLTPVDGQGVDFARLSQLGEQGIDLLLSDSTNSEIEGFTPSERSVGEGIKHEFRKAKGRIIIAAFASHIHRLQQIIDIAAVNKRKIAVDGRSMVRVFEIATDLGYLKVPQNLVIPLSEVDKLEDKKVVVLCTGTQGEPLAALSRIAKGMHKHIKVRPGDTVIISATPIPGNERAVSNNINNFSKEDAEVVFKKIAGIHVSGHGSREEQKLMLNLTKPKHFMPIHGEYRMLRAHKETAIETGIKPENIIIALNGSKVEVGKSGVRINGKVNTGVTLVDGLGVGDIGTSVIKDRQQLSQDGVVIIVFTLDKESGKVLAGPEITTKGFIYSRESETLIQEAIGNIKNRLKIYEDTKIGDLNNLKNSIRDIASKHFYSKIKRNPVILPIIMEV
ncbi:MAG: ribonuclease J [Fusobacteriaceae bacterium]